MNGFVTSLNRRAAVHTLRDKLGERCRGVVRGECEVVVESRSLYSESVNAPVRGRVEGRVVIIYASQVAMARSRRRQRGWRGRPAAGHDRVSAWSPSSAASSVSWSIIGVPVNSAAARCVSRGTWGKTSRVRGLLRHAVRLRYSRAGSGASDFPQAAAVRAAR